MKYLHQIVRKSAIFVIVLFSCILLNFSAFAACDGTGTALTTEPLTGLATTEELEAQGAISALNGTQWTPIDQEAYVAGMEWQVQFDDGVVTGYAGCAPTGWKASNVYNSLTSVNAGCVCSLDKNKWRFTKAFSNSDVGSTDRRVKTEYCRSHCPVECAARFASNQNSLRTNMVNDYGSCPAVAGGGNDPIEVHCNAGYYLPGGATECSACTGNYYCTEDTYYTSSQNQGLNTCDFGYEPNSAHTACTPKMVECADGEYLPGNSLECSSCTDTNYYCEADIYDFSAQPQGLKTCPEGQEPNAAHTGCITAKIHCDAGYYLPAGQSTCQQCTDEFYCESGNYDLSEIPQGLKTCAFGYEPNTNHDACTPKLIECNAGEYVIGGQLTCSPCYGNYYCEADIYEFSNQNQGLKTCPTGYEPTYDHTACELKQIHCNDGYYLPKNSVSCAACIGFQYCPEHTWTFSTETDQGNYTCASGTLPNSNHSECIETKITCPAGKYLPSYSSNEYDCQYCPDPWEVGDYYYCPGGEYNANAPIDSGMNLCPEYSYSEEEAEYCTCNEGYTTDGRVADGNNIHTTTQACLPENSAPTIASYVCDTGEEPAASGNVILGSSFTFLYPADLSCPEKANHTFAGWSDGHGNTYQGGDTMTWNYDSDVVFTAVWEEIPLYTITYSCGNESTGGYVPSAEEVRFHAQYTFKENTCERTGYDFLGWDYDDTDLYEAGETTTYIYNRDIEVVPMWSAKTISCESGYYSPAGSENCNTPCLANSYCPGGNYTYSDSNLGIVSCSADLPLWAKSYAHSSAMSDDISDCQIEIVSGTYAEEDGIHDCVESFYCSGFSGSVDSFMSILNESGMVGINDCSEAPAYKDWGWTAGITSNQNSTSMYDCKIVIEPATYMDENGVVQECVSDFYCPGKTYSYNEANTFFEELFDFGAGIYECPANTTSNASLTSCDCATGYVMDSNTSQCVESCGAGLYLPSGASACIAVGSGYYSPLSDQNRYPCPVGLTTTGSGIGADELGDCGRVLHIAGTNMRLRSIKKTIPSLNIKFGGNTYYGSMTTIPTNINANTDKKLHVKYGNVNQYVYDTTID
ncbi:MAG: InlB B-repeat-containing protein [Alphaproteobacteria bacterium]|nr:InlB B-repeat-containing protein [Alphaproteobacteria bacterium]